MEEDRALQTLTTILRRRKIDGDMVLVGSELDDMRMYTMGPILIVVSDKTRIILDTVLKYAEEHGYTSGIIIVSIDTPSESVLAGLRAYIADPTHPLVQIFSIKHLQTDISLHRKVPAHRIVTQDEVQQLVSLYKVRSSAQFPKIDCQDPMAKWIGARPGDVVEIIGICESSGENKRYRLCVENAHE